MSSRRTFLSLVIGAAATGIAGCSQVNLSEAPDKEPSATPEPTETEVDDTPAVQTPIPKDVTIPPRTFAYDNDDMLDITEVQADGGTKLQFTNTSEHVISRIELGGDDLTTNAIYFLRPGESVSVGNRNSNTGPTISVGYRESYYPPEQPYEISEQSQKRIITGRETENGLEFEFSSIDDGAVRDVRVSNFTTEDFITDSDQVILEDNVLTVPWEAVSNDYLKVPLNEVLIQTVTTEERAYLELPAPPVSVETAVDAEDKGDYLQLNRIMFDVQFESKKPSQYVRAYANNDRFLHQAFTTLSRETTEAGLVRIDSSEPTTVELEGGEISYPLEEETLDIMLMQGAPLYSEHVELTSLI